MKIDDRNEGQPHDREHDREYEDGPPKTRRRRLRHVVNLKMHAQIELLSAVALHLHPAFLWREFGHKRRVGFEQDVRVLRTVNFWRQYLEPRPIAADLPVDPFARRGLHRHLKTDSVGIM